MMFQQLLIFMLLYRVLAKNISAYKEASLIHIFCNAQLNFIQGWHSISLALNSFLLKQACPQILTLLLGHTFGRTVCEKSSFEPPLSKFEKASTYFSQIMSSLKDSIEDHYVNSRYVPLSLRKQNEFVRGNILSLEMLGKVTSLQIYLKQVSSAASVLSAFPYPVICYLIPKLTAVSEVSQKSLLLEKHTNSQVSMRCAQCLFLLFIYTWIQILKIAWNGIIKI